MTIGQVYVYAIRALKGEPIPLFIDRTINRRIEVSISKILARRTRRRASTVEGKSLNLGE